MIDLELLKEKLKKYNNKDLQIRLEGSLKLALNIYNAECFVSKKVIIIGNSGLEQNEEVQIFIDDINEMKINSEICLEMNRKLYNIYNSINILIN